MRIANKPNKCANCIACDRTKRRGQQHQLCLMLALALAWHPSGVVYTHVRICSFNRAHVIRANAMRAVMSHFRAAQHDSIVYTLYCTYIHTIGINISAPRAPKWENVYRRRVGQFSPPRDASSFDRACVSVCMCVEEVGLSAARTPSTLTSEAAARTVEHQLRLIVCHGWKRFLCALSHTQPPLVATGSEPTTSDFISVSHSAERMCVGGLLRT